MSKSKPSLVGRIIVFTIFGVIVTYFLIVTLGSIMTDLFGRPPPEQVGQLSISERNWCIRGLVGLRDELEGQVTLELHYPRKQGDPFSRWRSWNESWLKKFTNMKNRCVGAGNLSLNKAYQQLSALHAGYQSSVEQMIKTRAAAMNELQDTLQILKQQH